MRDLQERQRPAACLDERACESEGHVRQISNMKQYEPWYGLTPFTKSLEIQCIDTEQAPRTLASEILALTKMNWNNTQFDSALPITIKAARQVGAILKYVESAIPIQAGYGFYM